MKERQLGGLTVSEQGLGCMGMSFGYAPGEPDDAERTIRRALDLGVTYVDTADMYGPHTNEVLVGRAVRGHEGVVIGSKVGNEIVDGQLTWKVNGRPEYIRASIDGSLARLGRERLDLYYLHRVDPAVPVEESIGVLSELVAEGKVGAIGISEAGADTIRRAHAVHPLAAVQSEYSLLTRDVETNGVLDVTRELGIGFVAYSPIGRGMLSGGWSLAERGAMDFRHIAPRFAEENLEHNLALVERVTAIAEQHGVSTSQVALAWVLSRGEHVVALPGTKRVPYLEANVAASDLVLPAATLEALGAAIGADEVRGTRYPEWDMPLLGV